MKRTLLLAALAVCTALPAFAQSTEFGIVVGGSRRFIDAAPNHSGQPFLDSDFSFGNSAVDLYWATELDPGTWFKIKAGRIQTQIAVVDGVDTTTDPDTVFRRDVEGEVQHVDAIVEYRFSEPFGRSALFGGVGMYRQSGNGAEATRDYGYSVGTNTDFPLSRRYGVLVEAAYHWSRGDFRARYLTVGAGLRVSF